jgi:hypothetical protein
MTKALRWIVLPVMAVALAAAALAEPQQPAAPAAPPPAPCTAPELHQFDFWVGEWDLSWPGSGNSPGGTGTNRIEKILDGCVFQENFAAAGPQPLTGRSVSTYNAQEKKWKQTWVDSQGSYIDLTGEFQNGEMRLTRHAVGPDGKPRLMRMVYTNIKPDSFDWRWEASTDDGKTWQVQWPIHYKRKGTP